MSSDRVACDHAERCGGCPAIQLSYDEQLALKRGRVVQALARFASLELVYADPVLAADSVTEYRTRAKLIVGERGVIGLFAKGGGHDVVDVPRCRVLTPVVARVVDAIRERAKRDAEVGGPLAPPALRAIDVRELHCDGAPRALLTLVVHRHGSHDLAALRKVAARLLEEVPDVLGVAASLHDGDSPQVLGNETITLAGESEGADRVGKCVQYATFGSFVQAHRSQAARVHELVATHLGIGVKDGRARVLDLYAGSGAIALSLAARGADVTCVEAFGPAVARVEQAAKRAEVTVRSIHSDVASALRVLVEKEARFDAAVVNPPRRGVGPAAREWLARLSVPSIAYVSCDPDTLARDLDHFGRLGYRCASAQPLDMIPLSDEVETLAILRRITPPSPRVLYEDASVMFVEKSAHEPTTPQGEYQSSLITRTKRLDNAGALVAVHKLDIGTSGVVMFARTASEVAAWQAALAGARKVYLAATRAVLPAKGSVSRELRDSDGSTHPARTKYRRLAVFSGHCVARVIPEQGRTHQIRRHLASLGHPVLGDERYGHAATNRHFEEKYGLDRTFLHCVRFEIDHPRTGEKLIVESPLPGDLQTVLERAGGPGTLRLLDQKNALGRGVSSIPPAPSGPAPTSHRISTASDGRIVRADIVGEEDDPRD